MSFPIFVWFKDEKTKKEWKLMKPVLQLIALAIGRYFVDHNHQMIITDIMSEAAEDKRLKRVSHSHTEGRAFDFRTHGIPQDFLDSVEIKFENLFKQYAALSLATGKENLILYHDNGNGKHAHVQIRRNV